MSLKPAFVPCSTPAGPGIDALPVAHAATFPSSAYNLYDLMPEPPDAVVPLPLHQARNRDTVYDYETEHEGSYPVAMNIHAIIMLPLHPSVHLAHDVFDGMTFLSTSP
jgi:hypothetical protein